VIQIRCAGGKYLQSCQNAQQVARLLSRIVGIHESNAFDRDESFSIVLDASTGWAFSV
jgi:hypothetical protein